VRGVPTPSIDGTSSAAYWLPPACDVQAHAGERFGKQHGHDLLKSQTLQKFMRITGRRPGLPGPQGPSATAATKIATQFAGMRWENLHLRVPNHGRLFKALMTAHVPAWRSFDVVR
jgi:hypothetical protein